MPARKPQRIRLSPDRRASLLAGLQRHFEQEFDDDLSVFRGDALIDFFLAHLGPAVYNQGVHDAAAFMHERLTDIEGEIHEHEDR